MSTFSRPPQGPFIKCDTDAGLDVTTVTRGEAVYCDAYYRQGEALLGASIERWEFVLDTLGLTIAGGPGAWSGPLVRSGTLRVFARPGGVGGPPDQGSVKLKVKARAGWAQAMVSDVEEIPWDVPADPGAPGHNPLVPTALLSRAGQLGNTINRLEESSTQTAIEAVQTGPNSGLWFFRSPSMYRHWATIRIHREALAQGSIFHLLQHVTRSGGYCSRADVISFIAPLLAHEGIPMSSTSHTGAFRATATSTVQRRFEPVVAQTEDALKSHVVSEWFGAKTAAEKASGRVDLLYPVPLPCVFRYPTP